MFHVNVTSFGSVVHKIWGVNVQNFWAWRMTISCDCKFLIKIRHASLPNKHFFDNIFGGFASLDYVKLCGSDFAT